VSEKPLLQGYYFSQNTYLKNLGDCIAEIVVDYLGYKLIRCGVNNNAINAGRCLMPIGSVLDNNSLNRFNCPIDIWGCGSKGNWIDPPNLARLRVHAVRGPLTAKALKLPADIPMGDPALLLPFISTSETAKHSKTLVIPHLHQTTQQNASRRCRETGCDEMLMTQVYLDAIYPNSLKTILRMTKDYVHLKRLPQALWEVINTIAGASFVLTASLHGAIIAQAYGVPWAAYTDDYVDSPFKWYDWAAYLGVELNFVRDLEQGQQWWDAIGTEGRSRPLEPLIASFPYGILNEKAKVLAHTGLQSNQDSLSGIPMLNSTL